MMAANDKPHRPEPPLTPEQIRLAFRQLRRETWPDDIDAALAHPLRGPVIRIVARNLSRASACGLGTRPRLIGPPAPPTPSAPPPTPSAPPTRGKAIDRKRAAGNDFD